MIVAEIEVFVDRGSGRLERTSSRSRVWMSGCLQSMQIAQEIDDALVSWPAIRKVMSWLTRPSSEKPPHSMATERMSTVSLFLSGGVCFACWTSEWQVFWMTCDAAAMSSLRLILPMSVTSCRFELYSEKGLREIGDDPSRKEKP